MARNSKRHKVCALVVPVWCLGRDKRSSAREMPTAAPRAPLVPTPPDAVLRKSSLARETPTPTHHQIRRAPVAMGQRGEGGGSGEEERRWRTTERPATGRGGGERQATGSAPVAEEEGAPGANRGGGGHRRRRAGRVRERRVSDGKGGREREYVQLAWLAARVPAGLPAGATRPQATGSAIPSSSYVLRAVTEQSARYLCPITAPLRLNCR
uniref:Uncharacterized protein n=1 Tax=Oryza brachyantha TaxID=4533 RepID=J3LFB0_ORYBR